MCVIFPTKAVHVSSEDKPWITAEIKKLDKYVKKEYKARRKSDKYVQIKFVYDTKFLTASSSFIKGHPLSADLRYGEEDSIRPSTLIFSAIKG